MSKTKNVVIDDLNKRNEENETVQKSHDYLRLSRQTLDNLSSALYYATNELKGDGSISDAMCNSPLYGELLQTEMMASLVSMARMKAELKYDKMEWMELLKELYLQLQMFYKYGYVDNGDLKGIAWHMEPNGVFCLTLKDCAINMEYDVEEEHCPDDVRCRLFAVALNLPLLEREDPESEESHLCGEFDEFVTFTCQFKESGECRDVYPSHYTFTQAMRNILGSLDLISEMNNEKK